jgi:signal transduction histidine kinase
MISDGPVEPAAAVERLRRLQAVAAALVDTLTADDTAAVFVNEGMRALGADRAGVWRVVDYGEAIALVFARGHAKSNLDVFGRIRLDGRPMSPLQEAVSSRLAVWITSRTELDRRYPALVADPRLQLPAAYSSAVVPLLVEGRCVGVASFTYDHERAFTEDDRGFLLALTTYCAQAMERARLFEAELAARAQAEATTRRFGFLSEASVVLAESLDYEETLRRVASLAVPRIADWCAVELGGIEGQRRRIAVAHVDPAKVRFALELSEKYPPDPDAATGVAAVLRTGQPELYPDIPQEMLEASARDPDHLDMIRRLQLRSGMVVPIKLRDQVLGAITFIGAESGRRFGADDLDMALELARRAALAIENARLYERERAAVRVRDEFLSIAGHELRTPLSTLKLQIEAALRQHDAGKTEEIPARLERCARSIDRLERLVSELLDVSRITGGQIQLEREEVDLGELVSELCERLAEEAQRADAELRVSVESATGLFDRTRVEQVAMNLLTNAIKYGRGAPIEVEVADRDAIVELVVRDRGPGIDDADQLRIFERFERLVSQRRVAGLGLGLWIVREVVEAHGGRVHVASRAGQGSSFTVSLPKEPPKREEARPEPGFDSE